MRALSRRSKEYYAGGLMILIGAGAFFGGLRYRVGSLAHMGPGFFPAAVGALLTGVGIVIALTGSRKAPDNADVSKPRAEWRGWLCIVGSLVAFIFFGTYGGLVPASFAVAFISAFGDRKNSLRHALALGATMALIGAIVFGWGFEIQLPLFRWG